MVNFMQVLVTIFGPFEMDKKMNPSDKINYDILCTFSSLQEDHAGYLFLFRIVQTVIFTWCKFSDILPSSKFCLPHLP